MRSIKRPLSAEPDSNSPRDSEVSRHRHDGGSPITSYEVSAQLFDNSLPVTCRVNADQPLACTLRGNVRALDRQKTYTVKVTATNARGKSKPAKADFRRGR